MTPGERIKTIRRMRGYTQKGLGEELGFTGRTADARINQYERDTRYPKAELRQKLSDVLDVNPDNFSQHICETPEELYRSMIWIAKEYGGAAVHRCYMGWMYATVDQYYGVIDEAEAFRKRFVYEQEDKEYGR